MLGIELQPARHHGAVGRGSTMEWIALVTVQRLELGSLIRRQADDHPVPLAVGKVAAREIGAVSEHVVGVFRQRKTQHKRVPGKSGKHSRSHYLNES